MQTITFKEWASPFDADEFKTTLTAAENTLPTASSYKSMHGTTEANSSNAALSEGALISGSFIFDGAIYRLAADYSLAKINDLPANTHWQHEQYLNDDLALNTDTGKLYRYDTGSFKEVKDKNGKTLPIKGSHLTINQNFVVMANDDEPARVNWSGLGDYTDFVPAAVTQSGYQELYDMGKILGIHGEYIFCELGIKRFQFIGSEAIFQFDTISNLKILHHKTIAEHNNIVYFIADVGIYALSGNDAVNISDGFVTEYVKENIDRLRLESCNTGVYDNTIMFSIPFKGGGVKTLAFYSGRWSVLNDFSQFKTITTVAKPLDDFTGNLDKEKGSFDRYVESDATPIVVYDKRLAFIDSDSHLPSRFTTGTIRFDADNIQANWVKPILPNMEDGIKCILEYSDDGVVYSKATGEVSLRYGNATVRGIGQYFKVTLELNQPYPTISGLVLDTSP